jgi:cytoskeletal protein CcmA (bactofilin family)
MAAKNGLEMNSVIGEGSIFEGKFYISGSLQIDGRFQGEIRTENQVVVGETGKVKTDILAKRVVVAGTVIGNIEAEEEVNLLATGRVLGNIRAPKVDVEDGVVVEGEISISAGQKKNVKRIIEESFESGPKLDEIIKGPQGPRESDKESPQDARA